MSTLTLRESLKYLTIALLLSGSALAAEPVMYSSLGDYVANSAVDGKDYSPDDEDEYQIRAGDFIEKLSVEADLARERKSRLVVKVPDSGGGSIEYFLTIREALEMENISVHITAGCASACVLYTKMKNVCIEPTAQFKFHQGTNELATKMMLDGMASTLKTYLDNYGESLPEYRMRDTWGRDDRAPSYYQVFLVLEYEEAVERGMLRRCPSEPHPSL